MFTFWIRFHLQIGNCMHLTIIEHYESITVEVCLHHFHWNLLTKKLFFKTLNIAIMNKGCMVVLQFHLGLFVYIHNHSSISVLHMQCCEGMVSFGINEFHILYTSFISSLTMVVISSIQLEMRYGKCFAVLSINMFVGMSSHTECIFFF